MKFSLLIANFNNGKYFRDCYESIIRQTYKDWEVVIVDDFSNDDSVQIIKSIIGDDARFRFYLNSENKGTGYTKRKAAELANGVICGFLDPDDAITDDALEISIKQYTNENIVATYSKITFCDEHLNPKQDFKKVKKIYNNQFFFNLPIQIHHFFTFRKSTYMLTDGINPSITSAVDQDLYLKILEQGKAKFIRKTLYLYRRHDTGISQAGSKSKAKENFAKVIFETMKRRKIVEINGRKVPDTYPDSETIFSLLEYQNSIPYRLKLKVLNLFN